MSQQTNTRTTRRWLVLGLIAVAALAAIVVTLILADRGPTDLAPAQSSSGSASPSSEPADPLPTGCLGGPNRDASMVIAAMDAAPQSSNGATEVAAAFVRWLNQYPYPSEADARELQSKSISTDAPTTDLVGFFAAEPNLSGGLVPDGAPYYLSTVAGVFHIESVSAERAEISIGTSLVEDGALSPSLKGSITVSLSWEDGGWKFVSSEGTRTTEELYSIGRPFSEGC
jgi:hypothetical protein